MSEDEKKTNPNPQKYSWRNLKTFSTYDEARSFKESSKESLLKIKRTGAGGTKFTVKAGKEISKKEKAA